MPNKDEPAWERKMLQESLGKKITGLDKNPLTEDL
jgi:hypothetical protein